jgi:hypothetical protein
MKILPLQFWTEFRTPSGEVRELKNPEALASPRQLRRLNAAGALVVVEPGSAQPLRVGEAAFAVSVAGEAEPVDGQPPTRWRFSA